MSGVDVSPRFFVNQIAALAYMPVYTGAGFYRLYSKPTPLYASAALEGAKRRRNSFLYIDPAFYLHSFLT